MAFEWILKTPRAKEFEETSSITVETEELDQSNPAKPVVKRVKHVIEDKKRVVAPATRVRIVSFHQDAADERFYIRFLYGRTQDGKFQGALADDGIVYMGEGFAQLGINPDDGFQDDELLKMAASVLKWDGGLAETAD